MTSRRVSIIIPHRNQPERLWLCLERLMELGYGDQEIIVVNNGSEDSMGFLKNFPCQLFHSSSRPSPYMARNTGIQYANENVIVLLDVNAVVEPGWLEKALDLLTRDMIIAGLPLRPDPKKLDIYERFDFLYSIIHPVEDAPLQALPATNLFFYKKVWEEIGPFAEVRSLGDMEWTNRAYQKGYTLVADPGIRFRYPFKTRKDFTSKFRRLGGGKVENHFIRHPVWYIIKNFLPPSPSFVKRMIHKNRREEMGLSVFQLFFLCYWVKMNYGLGAIRYYIRNL